MALLARAVQRVRAYPLDSPLATQPLEAAHRAVAGLARDSLVLRVTRRVLLVDDAALPALPATTDLASRLHHASVATVALARDISTRDLRVFCRELVARDSVDPLAEPLPEALRQRGVQRIDVTLFEPPSVLDVGAPLASVLTDVGRRQRLPQEPSATAGHLYPAGKGWVRMDPGCRGLSRVSLVDLACLVADPFALAEMLVAMSDDPPPEDRADALARTFEDIAALFRSADPSVADGLLAGLARALLALDPDRRQRLLREAVLPGLIEGRLDGGVLRHFPDVDLADSLALLLDQQVAAPGLLLLALDRVELAEERRRRVEPLLHERLAARDATREARPGAVEGHCGDHIRIDLSSAKEFRDFTTFDLAMDAATDQALDEARRAVADTDLRQARLGCLMGLIQLEANPETAVRLLEKMEALLGEMRSDDAWGELADWVERLGRLHGALVAERSEVAGCIASTLDAVVDDGWVAEVARLAERQATGAAASRLVAAAGPTMAPSLVRYLTGNGRRQGLVRAVSAHAPALAPALAVHLVHPSADVVRDLVTILGHAGPGAEPLVAPALDHPDDRVVGEGCRALVRIASPDALRLVSGHLGGRGARARLAAEAYWQFPAAVAGMETRRLLGDWAFISAHPRAARRLIQQAHAHRVDGLSPLLRRLAALRTRVWRPSQLWLGLTAARTAGRQ